MLELEVIGFVLPNACQEPTPTAAAGSAVAIGQLIIEIWGSRGRGFKSCRPDGRWIAENASCPPQVASLYRLILLALQTHGLSV
jgi:hypothetical protein